VSMCLQRMSDNGLVLAVEDLWENPEVITYYQQPPPKAPLYNVPVLKNAVFCLAASHIEARTMKRDCPEANTEVVLWDIGLREGADRSSDEFLQLTGLDKGEYILQVGRVESRKNQLASVLATKDIDIPLVFVGTTGYQHWYELLVVNAAATYRKAPTIFLSQEHPSQEVGGGMRILRMPGGERLSEACLVSAFQNCGLHLHPAFWEAPGYVYLEAAYMGVPTVASSWGALQDYCEFGGNDLSMRDRFTYARPWHLPEIESAVRQTFGRKLDPSYTHPIFQRTAEDVGREIDAAIRKYF
jgi:glycosyltransferase involved in cell wall biosynthesis